MADTVRFFDPARMQPGELTDVVFNEKPHYMIYTKETGWIVAEFKVDQNDWNRIDLTFSANGADRDFIGDGSNYTDLYYY